VIDRYVSPAELRRLVSALLVVVGFIALVALFGFIVLPGLRFQAHTAQESPVPELRRQRRMAAGVCAALVLACAAIGSPGTVRARLTALIARTGADELILTSQIYDHATRVRSFEIAAALREG